MKEVLTPQQAPPLAAELRSHVTSPPVVPYVLDPIPQRPRTPKPPGPLVGDTIWYEDSELKRRHRELVKAGMEQARKLGKRIGRPPVTEREGFAERFREVVERIWTDGLSHRQAAKELNIGFATLKRLMDGDMPPTVTTRTPRRTLLPSKTGQYTPERGH